MKKKFSFLMILMVLSSFLFAGGQSEAASPAESMASQGPVEIDFWSTQTQSDRQATIQVLIDTFEIMNPNVKINLIPVDENDMATQLNTAAAAGKLPALLESPAENQVAFGSQGLLNSEAVTDLINTVGKDQFYAGTLKLNETEISGTYYAAPYHGWVQGIWYRSDWFEEAGLNPPNTWEDILKAAQYFYQPDKNQYGILVGTKPEAYAEQCFTQFAMSNGAGLFDKDGNLVFNTPEMKEAIEYYAEVAKYNPPGPQTWRARDYYLQGRMAMFFYSTYIMDDLAIAEVAAGSLTSENFNDLAGTSFDPDLVENTRMASTISHTEDAGFGVVVSLSLPDQGDPAKTEAAKKFLRYLYTPNAYITWLHMAPGGMNPVLKDIAVNARFQNDPKGIFNHYGTEKMAEIIDGLDNIETFSIVDGNRIAAASSIYSQQIIPQMLYKITQEGMSVDKAMVWAEEEMRKLQ
ncbi:ABC transporter substrate-binding protein [Oceanispirochaeta sp.]|jgi:multiple sugar transport system substrate-binding protein|uniref:ABC transporter substrate-binding protein n=1 Tax=Oceanispirochaeta sp. TaxID=2035350 RepID=UPI002613D3FF|nr:extracellular solute-binding protein [Oceanispirochaeta sp.]MDA3959040.1 extracellular solute-binding protein [Oceanispirochaeta sp.]